MGQRCYTYERVYMERAGRFPRRFIDAMPDGSPLPRLRFRLALDRDINVGPGKVDPLAADEAIGSTAAAGRLLGMSYKPAWHLLDTMNRWFKEALIQATTGGKGHGGHG